MPLIYHFRYAAAPELKIKMNVYNKLKIAILAIIASQNIHAIMLDPIQIQSEPGELLYAEINFRNADPDLSLQAGLASAEDLIAMGTGHQPPGHLNFFTRRDGTGAGVITITSSRPMTDAELNIIVKIQEGTSARLQHIKTPLKRSTTNSQRLLGRNEQALAPIIIRNEKDIALNLPTSTQYAAIKPITSLKTSESPLAVNRATPPNLMNNSNAPTGEVSNSVQIQTESSALSPLPKSEAPHLTSPENATNASGTVNNASGNVSNDPLVRKFADEMAAQKMATPSAQTQPTPEQSATPTDLTTPSKTSPQYVVQSNETLWGIASRIATEQNRPVAEVMKKIKANNEHAFIHGNANLLRRGVALNLDANTMPKERAKVSAAELAKVPSTQAGKTKYRLNQAEMSLVAEKTQDSAHASANKTTETDQTSNELSLKVMTAREKTVKLQRNVTHLELALNQKDHRIQLLNTRLAQLQQQLKARQVEQKPTN